MPRLRVRDVILQKHSSFPHGTQFLVGLGNSLRKLSKLNKLLFFFNNTIACECCQLLRHLNRRNAIRQISCR